MQMYLHGGAPVDSLKLPLLRQPRLAAAFLVPLAPKSARWIHETMYLDSYVGYRDIHRRRYGYG